MTLFLAVQPGGSERVLPRAGLEQLAPAALGRLLLGANGRRILHRQFCVTTPGTFCGNGGPGGDIFLATAYRSTDVRGVCASNRYVVPSRRGDEAGTSVVIGQPRTWLAYTFGERCRDLDIQDDGPGSGFAIGGTGAIDGAAAAHFILNAARLARTGIAQRRIAVDCRPAPYSRTRLCDHPADILDDRKLAGMRAASIQPGAPGEGAHLLLQLWNGRSGGMLEPIEMKLFLEHVPTHADARVAITRATVTGNFFVD